jgi:hypothetical protein
MPVCMNSASLTCNSQGQVLDTPYIQARCIFLKGKVSQVTYCALSPASFSLFTHIFKLIAIP